MSPEELISNIHHSLAYPDVPLFIRVSDQKNCVSKLMSNEEFYSAEKDGVRKYFKGVHAICNFLDVGETFFHLRLRSDQLFHGWKIKKMGSVASKVAQLVFEF